MQRVEVGVDVRDEKLRGERGQQCLRVRAEVRWDLRALPDANLHSPRPAILSTKTRIEKTQKHTLTFFSNPSTSTGSIFIFSDTASCALAPAPAAVMLALYACSISTSLLNNASRLSSSLCVIARSTPLFASSVAIAIWSADANKSDRFDVVGSAVVMTRIRRSPVRVRGQVTWNGATVGAYRSTSYVAQPSGTRRTAP